MWFDLKKIRKTLQTGLLVWSVFMMPMAFAEEQLLSQEEFLKEAFNQQTPALDVLWITKDVGMQAEKILGHKPNQLRQRYWKKDGKTAWVLEEIGKEEPITAGFVIEAGKIQAARVLVYRESRGGEIKYPAFLKQYFGAQLTGSTMLNQPIDGISGATLSVNAMNRMARLALMFDSQSRENK